MKSGDRAVRRTRSIEADEHALFDARDSPLPPPAGQMRVDRGLRAAAPAEDRRELLSREEAVAGQEGLWFHGIRSPKLANYCIFRRLSACSCERSGLSSSADVAAQGARWAQPWRGPLGGRPLPTLIAEPKDRPARRRRQGRACEVMRWRHGLDDGEHGLHSSGGGDGAWPFSATTVRSPRLPIRLRTCSGGDLQRRSPRSDSIRSPFERGLKTLHIKVLSVRTNRASEQYAELRYPGTDQAREAADMLLPKLLEYGER